MCKAQKGQSQRGLLYAFLLRMFAPTLTMPASTSQNLSRLGAFSFQELSSIIEQIFLGKQVNEWNNLLNC